jgi:hypothetical protein
MAISTTERSANPCWWEGGTLAVPSTTRAGDSIVLEDMGRAQSWGVRPEDSRGTERGERLPREPWRMLRYLPALSIVVHHGHFMDTREKTPRFQASADERAIHHRTP